MTFSLDAAERFGVPEATDAFRAACAAAGLPDEGAQLIRLGGNAVFRLVDGATVVRIGRSAAHLARATREVAVARWLEREGFPAVRPAAVGDQPLVVLGRTATFWQLLARGDEYGTTAELAALLVRLHALTPPSGMALGSGRSAAQSLERLSAAPITGGDRTFLVDRLADAQADYERLTFPLAAGPIHGDANVGNVVRDHDGRAVLIDFDSFTRGPREWDLVLTAIYFADFGWHTEREYRAFVDCYGFDVLGWSGYPVLRELRTLMMVAWLAQKVGEGPDRRAEFDKRVHALRTGGARRDWSPL